MTPGTAAYAPTKGVAIAVLLLPTAAVAASTGVEISFGRIIAALLLCLLLALALALLVRKRATRAPLTFAAMLQHWDRPAPSALTIVETRRMSMHGDISVVHWGDQEFLLACGPGGFLLLGQRERSQHALEPDAE